MIKELLKSKGTFATPVVLFLFQELGSDALTFEPETIADKLRMVEASVDQSLIDRVNAALGLFTTDLFWNDPIVFGAVCRSLNRRRFATSAEPSIGDICWGVTEANLLTTDVVDGEAKDAFNESIIKYVKYTLKLNALYSTPKSLQADFGEVPYNFVIDDPAIAEARQTEFDAAAARIDALVADKMYLLLHQIKHSGVKLTDSATKDVDQLLSEHQQNA